MLVGEVKGEGERVFVGRYQLIINAVAAFGLKRRNEGDPQMIRTGLGDDCIDIGTIGPTNRHPWSINGFVEDQIDLLHQATD